MRRFVGLLVLVFFAVPFGISVAGCGHSAAVVYCNGSGYGPVAGQVKSITLASNLSATGESLSYGQIGQQLSASAQDCNGGSVSVSKYTYATTDMSVADVNPSTGSVCAGSWNRNSGGGVADFTICTPPAASPKYTAFITASAAGATSNAIQVFIHPPVTGVVLGGPTANCSSSNDPGTDCFSTSTTGTTVTAPPYDVTKCLSQNHTAQLVARVYTNGTTLPQDNITAKVGRLNFALQGTADIASIDANGVATANQPGSALVNATVANSSSAVNSGFISTCPPASIVLTAVNQTPNATGGITVGLNNPQAFTATVTDTNHNVLNGVALEFNSTLPINFPTNGGTVTPAFPGSATITAACVPPTCNPAPFSQIGYQGNGVSVTSNGITVTAAGTASTVLYMGSTNSLYIASEDFTTGQLGSPVKLPYPPNSMVISQDGSTIYMGSSGGLTTLATASGAAASVFQGIQGTVLAVAPNNSYVVVTDPTRQTVSLVTPTGSIASSFNGVGTRAQWTPDSNTLYVTTAATPAGQPGPLLTYSTFLGWQTTNPDEQYNDVAVTVPSVGAYFAGPATEGRSYCPSTTIASTGTPPAATNVFSPLADVQATTTDRLAYTTDGRHLLGATAQSQQTSQTTLDDFTVALPTETACPGLVSPGYFKSSVQTHPLTAVKATAINGIVPSSNSTVAAVTYNGTGGVLPLYAPGLGAIDNVTLSGGATAAVAGVFSTDDTTFYAGTAGDNVVHIVNIKGTTGTDAGIITPSLPAVTGSGNATPNLIVQRPRRSTS